MYDDNIQRICLAESANNQDATLAEIIVITVNLIRLQQVTTNTTYDYWLLPTTLDIRSRISFAFQPPVPQQFLDCPVISILKDYTQKGIARTGVSSIEADYEYSHDCRLFYLEMWPSGQYHTVRNPLISGAVYFPSTMLPLFLALVDFKSQDLLVHTYVSECTLFPSVTTTIIFLLSNLSRFFHFPWARGSIYTCYGPEP